METFSAAWPGVVLVVAALPGIVFSATRGHALGVTGIHTSVSSRVAQGLVAAVVLDLIYLIILGELLVKMLTTPPASSGDVRTVATYLLVLCVLAPAIIAWLLHRGHRWHAPAQGPVAWGAGRIAKVRRRCSIWVKRHLGWTTRRFSTTPRAWDFALPERGGRFVRIETVDGKFLGGWFADRSFLSTYPEAHDIFIERQYRLSEKGEFMGPLEGSDGFWYLVRPGDSIDWVDPRELETIGDA